MDLICENYFEKKYERRIESFEKETLLGIFEIINKMHKHAIEDYKNVIDYYLTEDLEEIKSDTEFEKIYSEQFHLMFEHIAEDFKWRLEDLKSELEKRLDIRYKNESDNESENESNNESDNESENESKKESIISSFIKNGSWKKIGKYSVPEDSPLINSSEAELDEQFKNVLKGLKQREEDESDNESENESKKELCNI